jgi:hypothetical protein
VSILIATWNPGQDPAVDGPGDVRWEDGRPATLEDYARHGADTRSLTQERDGSLVMTMLPGVVADVRFDHAISRWICHTSQRNVILELTDRDVSDEEIVAELSTYPVFYRAVIHRATIR